MYREYARDPRMRINVGIRRRLAPLMDNGRRQIELMNALLMSMPGTPIIYYGDEIGMGDNVYLGDRNGVRTPMQWNGRPQRRLLRGRQRRALQPADRRSAVRLPGASTSRRRSGRDSSLLHWMRAADRGAQDVARVRPRHLRGPAARPIAACSPSCASTRTRRCSCVQPRAHARARGARPAPLRGLVPIELWSERPFPPIGEQPYLLTFGPYGYYWFRLARGHGRGAGRMTGPAGGASPHDWVALPTAALGAWIQRQRWSGAHGALLADVRVAAAVPVPQPDGAACALVYVDAAVGRARGTLAAAARGDARDARATLPGTTRIPRPAVSSRRGAMTGAPCGRCATRRTAPPSARRCARRSPMGPRSRVARRTARPSSGARDRPASATRCMRPSRRASAVRSRATRPSCSATRRS